MTDVDPKIWENPTLGSAGAGPFLPEVEKQSIEDYNARKEGREANTVEYVHRYPALTESRTVPSIVNDFVVTDPNGEVIEQVPATEPGPAFTYAENLAVNEEVSEGEQVVNEDEDETPVAESSDSPDSPSNSSSTLPTF